MASTGFFEAFVLLFLSLLFYYFLSKKPFDCLKFKKSLKSYPWNWPVLGMLPTLWMWFRQIDDAIWFIEKSNLTFLFKGPWFSRIDFLVTVDPANIHHILSSNFSNYIKGPEMKEIFDVYGDATVNTDSEIWKNMRMSSQSMIHQGFQKLSINTTKRKLKEVLLPLLNHFAEERTIVDLQDVFGRFTFDTTLVTITGSDPKSLSVDMQEINEFAKAFDDSAEAVFRRHIVPRFIWKLESWIGFGQEKKMTEARATFDRLCAKYVSDKREEIRSQETSTHQSKEEEGEDILTSSLKLDTTKYALLTTSDNKFFRDIILTFVLGGRDTIASALTWFFWIMSENPKIVAKIRKEINTNQEMFSPSTNPMEYLNKLVYLHAALYETMRLYSPVPFERKSPVKTDVLPSGHKVKANSNVIIPIYALGRMKAVWGEDALEFRPERWISESGGLRHEPSFKYLVFNAGPRSCLGKHLAMNVLKTVVVEILQNFDIKVVEGHKVEPKPGLILLVRHGLRVTLTKTCST